MPSRWIINIYLKLFFLRSFQVYSTYIFYLSFTFVIIILQIKALLPPMSTRLCARPLYHPRHPLSPFSAWHILASLRLPPPARKGAREQERRPKHRHSVAKRRALAHPFAFRLRGEYFALPLYMYASNVYLYTAGEGGMSAIYIYVSMCARARERVSRACARKRGICFDGSEPPEHRSPCYPLPLSLILSIPLLPAALRRFSPLRFFAELSRSRAHSTRLTFFFLM